MLRLYFFFIILLIPLNALAQDELYHNKIKEFENNIEEITKLTDKFIEKIVKNFALYKRNKRLSQKSIKKECANIDIVVKKCKISHLNLLTCSIPQKLPQKVQKKLYEVKDNRAKVYYNLINFFDHIKNYYTTQEIKYYQQAKQSWSKSIQYSNLANQGLTEAYNSVMSISNHNRIPIILLCIFIFVLFIHSLYFLIVKGKILIWTNLAQPFLFCLLYFLIYKNLGAHHYQTISNPEWNDWIQFTFAHIFRAVDILDFIEEYGISLQNIRHNSNFLAGCLILMHWMVDIFIVALLFKFILKKIIQLEKIKKIFNNIGRWWNEEYSRFLDFIIRPDINDSFLFMGYILDSKCFLYNTYKPLLKYLSYSSISRGGILFFFILHVLYGLYSFSAI